MKVAVVSLVLAGILVTSSVAGLQLEPVRRSESTSAPGELRSAWI